MRKTHRSLQLRKLDTAAAVSTLIINAKSCYRGSESVHPDYQCYCYCGIVMGGFPSTPFKALDKVWEIFGRSQGLKDVLSVCFFLA